LKTLVCEMCGSNDLLKEDGVFVCQNCKTRYSVEEAKRMMVEGTVDVTGTVKVDNSDSVEKYLQNARRAKAKEDWEETEKYYNPVEQEDPDNIEAVFYSAYGKAKRSLIEDDIYKRQQVFKMFTNCISIIDDKFDAEKAKDEEEAISAICKDMKILISSEFVYTLRKNLKGEVTENNSYMTYNLFKVAAAMFVGTLNHITKKAPEKYLYLLLIDFINYYNDLSYVHEKPFKDIFYEALENLGRMEEDPKVKRLALETRIKDLEEERYSLSYNINNGCLAAGIIASIILSATAFVCCWISNDFETYPLMIKISLGLFGVMMLITFICDASHKAKVKKNRWVEKLAELESEIEKVKNELANL